MAEEISVFNVGVRSQKLERRRRELGLSQEELAQRMGVTRSYYNEIVRGRRPGVDFILRAMVILQRQFEDLFGIEVVGRPPVI